MFRKIKMRIGVISLIIFTLPFIAFAEEVGVFFDSNVPQIKFAADDVKIALESKSFTVDMLPLSSLTSTYANKKVIIALSSNATVIEVLTNQGAALPTGLGEQAYALRTTEIPQASFWALGGDLTGAMYGGLQIAENISASGFSGTYNNQESPFLLSRGMKLNMPLDKRIPTYVGGWSSTSAKKAIPNVWDMTFWKTLIDQQARFRYNLLTVWVHHPFPALVKLDDYPNASLPRIEGFDGYVKELNHEQRVEFWREVMQYAHDRGMKFYFFNWNIYVDYAKDQYSSIDRDQDNPITLDYMYKSLQALIETYPDLDGFGISAGDGMEHTENNEPMKWTWNAMGKAVTDYLAENPTREFNLIHRSIYANPEGWNTIYAPLRALPNATMNFSSKYAMAHMYSTPTPRWTNDISDVKSLGLKTWITLRNDDYFYINWGDPKFVRDFMAGIPNKEAVVGMYIGSDGYNPSRTYFCKNDEFNGQLEVERRWYMEMLWGRISYNPEISDDVFKNMLAKRFPTVSAGNLFDAWSLASRSLPKVTELVMRSWSLDFHWYPEACWSDPGRGTGFRTIDGFANETSIAKGSDLCSIANSAAGNCSGKKSSYDVADEMQKDAENALSLISTMNGIGNADLQMTITNVRQMALLSAYYAFKIRGATYKKAGKTNEALEAMSNAYCYWRKYSSSMDSTYYGDSFRNVAVSPDWKFADAAVLKEYTDLGGTGAPICGTESYMVNLSSNDDTKGSVLGFGSYNPNDEVTVTAVPKTGYRFVRWMENDVMVSSNINYKFIIENDRQLIAYFIERDSCGFPWNDAGITVNKETVNKTFGPIDISCAPDGVIISMNLEGVGADNSDYCKVYYKIDGGAEKQITSNNGPFSLKTVSASGIIGEKLEIIVKCSTSWADEFYYITNIQVNNLATSNNSIQLDNIEIYPNPVSKTLNIVFSDNMIYREVKVFNSIGQVAYTAKTNKSKIELDVQSLHLQGTVVIQVQTDNEVSNHKIVVI